MMIGDHMMTVNEDHVIDQVIDHDHVIGDDQVD